MNDLPQIEDAALRQVLEFWLVQTGPEQWFSQDDALDAEIRVKFLELHKRAVADELAHWRGMPEGCLGEIILLDQFSRNLYRNDPRAYAADDQARGIMTLALVRGFDEGMSEDERRFLYMPLQHSEDVDDQARSVELFRSLEDGDTFKYTLRHQEIIDRFGRFPHRNSDLGRTSTAEEIAFLQEADSSF
ncbi:MAG: DUF924 domain-containing protein [Proteobacteria bacterium]|nr:DUF924 domain-containing protein [Pseudomonadota bacterium]MDA1357752.1 DUF924 domain-containing protein [Pseudomonadota bacterium]